MYNLAFTATQAHLSPTDIGNISYLPFSSIVTY